MSFHDDPSIDLCSINNSFVERNTQLQLPVSFKNTTTSAKVKILVSNQSSSSNANSDTLSELRQQLKVTPKPMMRQTSVFKYMEALTLANIDSVCAVTGHLGNLINPQDMAPANYCDLVTGPSGCTEYLLWRRPASLVYGATNKSNNNLKDWALATDHFKAYLINNLSNEWKALESFLKEKNSSGFDAVFYSELANDQLLVLISYLGISLTKQAGNFLCKLPSLNSPLIRDLIYISSQHFEEIILFKPLASDQHEAEIYLIAKNRNTLATTTLLKKLLTLQQTKHIISIFVELPQAFLDWFNAAKQRDYERRKYYLEYLLEHKEFPKLNYHKALIIWDLPGGRDNIKLNTVISVGKTSLIPERYQRDDLYSYESLENLDINNIDFPYKVLYYTEQDILQMFLNLKHYKSQFYYPDGYTIANLKINKEKLKYKGLYQAILVKEEEYQLFNILSDMFNEYARMKAIVYGKQYSPYDYFFKHLKSLAAQALKTYQIITPYTLRETLYQNYKEVTSFRPNLVTTIVKMFNSRNMFDFCAGWGDRLIGALAANIGYIGVDPNPDVHVGYKAILDFFSSFDELAIDRNNYQLYESAIEDFDTSKLEKVDLVMTSPPYFDLESYSDDPRQSIIRYKTEAEWIKKFLLVALAKAVEVLNEGGYLVIVINQKSEKENYINSMLSYLERLNYLGVISYARLINKSLKGAQPMWIWRKGNAYLYLEPITTDMRVTLKRLVTDSEVMKYLANGRIWSNTDIDKFLSYQEKPDPDYYQRAIIVDGRLEGMVQIHVVNYAKGFFVTRCINRNMQGQGLGTAALDYAIQDFSREHPEVEEIYSDTLENNIAAQKSLLKIGFKFFRDVKISNKKYKRYIFKLH